MKILDRWKAEAKYIIKSASESLSDRIEVRPHKLIFPQETILKLIAVVRKQGEALYSISNWEDDEDYKHRDWLENIQIARQTREEVKKMLDE